MVSFETSDLKKIGYGLAALGIIFTSAGVFLDNSFLAIGNILLLSGVILTSGVNSLQFFLRPKNYTSSVPLVSGFVFVVSGWPITGLILETCGFVFLSREIWDVIVKFLRRLPILGSMLHRFNRPPYFARSIGHRCPV